MFEIEKWMFRTFISLSSDTVEEIKEKMEEDQTIEDKPDNVTPANSPVSTNSQSSQHTMNDKLDKTDGAINLSSKYEQLVRSQMIDKAAESDPDTDKRFADLNGRGTPVGEDSVSQFQDNEQSRLSHKHLSQDDSDSIKNALLDSYLRKSNSNINASLGINDVLDRKDMLIISDELGSSQLKTSNYKAESPLLSRHSSRHSSACPTPAFAEGRDQDRCSSVGSVHSVHSKTSPLDRSVLDDLINDVANRERKLAAEDSQEEKMTSSLRSRPSSVASEPRSIVSETLHRTAYAGSTFTEAKRTNGSASPEQIGDVLNPTDRHSPIRQEFLSGPPFVPTSGTASGSNNSSQRSTPKDLISPSFRSSQEKLYSEVKARIVSDGSNHSSQAGSRPQSVTSEQELSQYYDNMTDTRTGLGQNGQRINGACSLPAVGAAKRLPVEKRSYTPDNLIRVPVTGSNKGSYMNNKTPPQSPFSNASSRTVTPVNAATDDEQKLREVGSAIADRSIFLSR